MIDLEENEEAAFGRNMGERFQARLSVAGKKKQIIAQATLHPALVAEGYGRRRSKAGTSYIPQTMTVQSSS